MLTTLRRLSQRRFPPNFASRRRYESTKRPPTPKEHQLNPLTFLGPTLGVIGTIYVTAEYRLSDGDTRATPTRSSYKYLICGGGIAAQAALQVFVDHGAADDVLLVAPEWMDCTRWLHHDHVNTRPLFETEERSTIPEVLTGFQTTLHYYLTPFIGKRAPSKVPEIVIGPTVKNIDISERIATLSDGSEVGFQRCLIAVGSTIPKIPIGKVVSRDAVSLVSGAQSKSDWRAIDDVIRDGEQAMSSDCRAHLTVVGGGWMATAVGAKLVERGADLTFSYSEPAFLARYLPKYLGQELFSRFLWHSQGRVDTLSYSALRYIVARRPMLKSFRPIEAEVHVGTVFDAFSIVDFRTDHVIFAPTLPTNIPLDISPISQANGFVVNAELAIASDIYAAGACVNAGAVQGEYPEVMRWSADHATSTGRHAALNILGAREPYAHFPTLTVDLGPLCLQLYIIGDVNGSAESFGYFQRSKERSEDLCGGQLENGVLFCVQPVPLSHRGATQKLCITGVMIWEGSKIVKAGNVSSVKQTAVKLVNRDALTRPELEQAMDSFATSELGISLFVDEPKPTKRPPMELPSEPTDDSDKRNGSDTCQTAPKRLFDLRKPSTRVIWRRHRSARGSRVRPKELLWVEDEWVGAVSPQTGDDKISQAYADLLRNAAAND